MTSARNALKYAQKELDDLTRQMEREAAAGQTNAARAGVARAGATGQTNRTMSAAGVGRTNQIAVNGDGSAARADSKLRLTHKAIRGMEIKGSEAKMARATIPKMPRRKMAKTEIKTSRQIAILPANKTVRRSRKAINQRKQDSALRLVSSKGKLANSRKAGQPVGAGATASV